MHLISGALRSGSEHVPCPRRRLQRFLHQDFATHSTYKLILHSCHQILTDPDMRPYACLDDHVYCTLLFVMKIFIYNYLFSSETSYIEYYKKFPDEKPSSELHGNE
jgi:hypothetical protein